MPRSTGTFLERLEAGPVIGDGGFVCALERRGYVEAGVWTPEAVVEHPEAVKQLHREFLRAGSDVCQAFTFYATEDRFTDKSRGAGKHGVRAISEAACRIALEVAHPEGALVTGGVSETPTYLNRGNMEDVKAEVKKQLQVFKEQKVDLMIAEYYEHVEEAEWHVQAIKEYMPGTPVCVTLALNTDTGDMHGIPVGECGVRLAKVGADVVGVNCLFDPFRNLATVIKMRDAIKEAGLKCHFMIQPMAFWTPDAGVKGYIDLPDYPFALEPRTLTRWDVHKYARAAWDAGIHYIGGCCGFEPYHIRAVSEELTEERGGYLPFNSVHWGRGLQKHTKPWVRARGTRKHWENLNPSTGRPFSAAFSKLPKEVDY